MTPVPSGVAAFMSCKRVAVAGVSRSGRQPASAVFRKLRDAGCDAVPINPHARRREAEAALQACTSLGIEPVDLPHRCMRWRLARQGRP